MRVDFHVHSTASDGTLSPDEIIARAESWGFSAIALTDHDNCDGAASFLQCARKTSLKALAGIELSIDPGVGFDKFHLLGLGIDPTDVGLQAFLRRVLDGRRARNAKIIANFNRLGIDIRPQPHGEVLARPHFAAWLADHGYAATKAEAFAQYLLPDSPLATRCYEERYHPPQDEAFDVIHAAGGVCIMAHPKFWCNDWKSTGCDYAAAGRDLAILKEKGLDGIEALYSANTADEDAQFCRLADKYGLLKTAGSDFHGGNKPNIALGMDVSECFIQPFLERLTPRVKI